MAENSKIEWTDHTFNPWIGCQKVSTGCDHCYALAFAERFRGVPNHPYEQGFDLRLWPERLELPLTWRKPRRIFVNSMSDSALATGDEPVNAFEAELVNRTDQRFGADETDGCRNPPEEVGSPGDLI